LILLRHLPNALTAFRLLAAPVLAVLLNDRFFALALALFVLAGCSDVLDGYLAKRLAPGSRFGAWLDPAADKILMLVAFVVLTRLNLTPLWLTAIVIGRDIAIVAGIILIRYLSLPLTIAPLPVGKLSTVVQVAYVGFVLVSLSFKLDLTWLNRAAEILVAVVTFASWLAYGQLLLKTLALGRRMA
jgi:cardiolipin synthase (CMP-forming)